MMVSDRRCRQICRSTSLSLSAYCTASLVPDHYAKHACHLKKGGHLCVQLYGHERNEAYLVLVKPLCSLTTGLPYRALSYLTCLPGVVAMAVWRHGAGTVLDAAIIHPRVYNKFAADSRRLVIYNQLARTIHWPGRPMPTTSVKPMRTHSLKRMGSPGCASMAGAVTIGQ